MSIAMTTKVYGRRNARRTIHMSVPSVVRKRETRNRTRETRELQNPLCAPARTLGAGARPDPLGDSRVEKTLGQPPRHERRVRVRIHRRRDESAIVEKRE